MLSNCPREIACESFLAVRLDADGIRTIITPTEKGLYLLDGHSHLTNSVLNVGRISQT